MIDWSAVALWIGVAIVVLNWVIRILAIVYVPRNRRPQTAMAWLLAIFFQPIAGIILFGLVGSRHLPRKRREKQREVNNYILETTAGMDLVRRDHTWPSWLDPIVSLNRNLGAMPLVGGNTATLHDNYGESLATLTNALKTAERYIHAEFYILSLDSTTLPFFDELEAAVKRGVKVRVLIDHIALWRSTGYRKTLKRLTEIGTDWHLMLPVQPFKGKFQRPDLRNHRKLLIIDGLVGYTGSQNVIDSSYNKRSNIKRGLHWKDLMVRFEGPIVAGINALFVTDWYTETDELLVREVEGIPKSVGADLLDAQVVPSGPGFDGENNLRLFNSLIYAAQERVIITSPYFVPDESMYYAITTAAQSGIDVQLFVSSIGDQTMVYHAQRSYYEGLLRAGVRIWLYHSPTILHAKHLTIDDQVAIIGSSNMDMRSFSLDLEISVMIKGSQFVTSLRQVEDSYRTNSRELLLEEWLRRPWASKILDNVMRLTAAVQ
jgi:cardiolipin synthase A/B